MMARHRSLPAGSDGLWLSLSKVYWKIWPTGVSLGPGSASRNQEPPESRSRPAGRQSGSRHRPEGQDHLRRPNRG